MPLVLAGGSHPQVQDIAPEYALVQHPACKQRKIASCSISRLPLTSRVPKTPRVGHPGGRLHAVEPPNKTSIGDTPGVGLVGAPAGHACTQRLPPA